MKFKLDENLSDSIKKRFSEFGYDAVSVSEEKIGGCGDDELYNICVTENRCLITLDKDFADIKRFPTHQNPGIVVLRLSQNLSLNGINNLLSIFFSELKRNSVANRLWIVEPNRIRIRSEEDMG